jgi:hypothetical protein
VRKRVLAIVALTGALMLSALPAHAGSPHIPDAQATLTQDGNTLTVHFKVAGLGDETQIHVVLTADSACWNRGGNKPAAENKSAVLAEGNFPVQNGKAQGDLSGTATFDPSAPCPVPLVIRYTNVVLTVSGDSFETFSLNL